ncbi:MAG: universal stress protein [Pseudomonadota bacterium]
MSLTNLLVAYNGSDSSETALQAALHLHQQHGGHLTGISAHAGQRDRFSRQAWVPDTVRSMLDTAVAEDEDRVQTRFREIVGNTVPEGQLHWISLYGQPDTTVAQYASLYDLTLVGRYDAVTGRDNMDVHPEHIALKSGRPVLMVPGALTEALSTRTAVLAWDGHRAATRAINDATVLLGPDQLVQAITFGTRQVRPPLEGIDVAEALRRQGLNAERVRKAEVQTSVGEDLLAHCAEIDAGLLIMGAFERSAFREELFGGPTKYILSHAELPVLISH